MMYLSRCALSVVLSLNLSSTPSLNSNSFVLRPATLLIPTNSTQTVIGIDSSCSDSVSILSCLLVGILLEFADRNFLICSI